MRAIATQKGYFGGMIVEAGEYIEVTEEQFSKAWMRLPDEEIAPASEEGLKIAQAEAAKKAVEPKTLAEALKDATPVPVPQTATVELYKAGSK